MSDSIEAVVHGEIYQQPGPWLTTLERVSERCGHLGSLLTLPAVISGAGTSAYAATAVAAAWPGAGFIASTDLLAAPPSRFPGSSFSVESISGRSSRSLS